MGTFFDPTRFDARSESELERRVKEATTELRKKLAVSNEELHRLEKRLFICERESRGSISRPANETKDPREALDELLKMVHSDLLLRMLKQAVGEEGEQELLGVMAELLSHHNGVNFLELQQELATEVSRRKTVEMQFAKTQDSLNASHRAEIEKLKRELEIEKARPNEELKKLQKQIEELQKEKEGLMRRNKELIQEKAQLVQQCDEDQAKRITAENVLAEERKKKIEKEARKANTEQSIEGMKTEALAAAVVEAFSTK